MKHILLALTLIFTSLTATYAETTKEEEAKTKEQMKEVFNTFIKLQRYLVRPAEFKKKANAEDVLLLIKELNLRFHSVEQLPGRFQREPGLVNTVKTFKETLADSEKRFSEGSKDYALWRLKSSTNYCISCHTRYEVKSDYVPSENIAEGLSDFEKGEFYFATRQFDKASESFLAALHSSSKDEMINWQRFEALKRWLVIQIRVHPSPVEAIETLKKINSEKKIPLLDAQEVDSWVYELELWAKEKDSQEVSFEKAKKLVERGIAINDPLKGRSGVVDLLRATAMLHKLLESPLARVDRGEALYLLGLSYAELPQFGSGELPVLFLEQCIRENPKSKPAQLAFKKYKEYVTLSFSGSGGTFLPEDVQSLFDELRKIAYGQ